MLPFQPFQEDESANGYSLLELFPLPDVFFSHLNTVLEIALFHLSLDIPHHLIWREICLPSQQDWVGWGLLILLVYLPLNFLLPTRLLSPCSHLFCLRVVTVYCDDVKNAQLSLKSAVKHSKSSNALTAKAELLADVPGCLQSSVELASERERRVGLH